LLFGSAISASALHRRLAVQLADVVQKQVHQAHAARVGHDLVAVEGGIAQKPLRLVQSSVRTSQPVVGTRKKPPCRKPGRRWSCRLWTHTTMAWIIARGVKYWPAPLLVSSAFFCSRPFVEIALGVGIQPDPALGVDHLHQARQLGRVLDLVLRLEEDRAQHAGSPSLCRVAR
jgi:hypothetical protein